MLNQFAIESLKNPDMVLRTYHGGSGCMCGCIGDYSDGYSARRVNRILANPESANFDAAANCAYLEQEGKITAVYFR